MIHSRTFRAMGTDVSVLIDAAPDADREEAFLEAELEIRRLEGLLSRFRPDSELSRLNRAGGLDAGPELTELVGLALTARESTGGRFDPTVHDAVQAAGYDRSFELLQDGRAVVREAPAPCAGMVHVDPEAGWIGLEPGVRLDLGGIAKGWTADRVCGMLAAQGHGPCLVNVGGDLATHGIPDCGSWDVGVETWEGTLTLALQRGGMATSGRDRRRWNRGGEEAHHVIDPRTARPSGTDLWRVTVVASTAADAEVLATALMLSGSEAAAREADALGVPCVLVPEEGPARLAGGL